MFFRRRVLLVLLALVGAFYGIFRSWRIVSSFLTGAEKEASPIASGSPFRSQDQSLVAVVGGTEVKEMVRKAVNLIGGFEPLDIAGKSVLVKPNVVGAQSHPTTTNPAVVGAVVELLYEAGATKVYVGDMSALIRGGTGKNMEKTGIAAAARKAGAELVSFEDHGWVKVKVSGRYLQEVDVTEWFFNVEKIINLPVIKTHRYAGYSICLKNFVGATHFSQRPYLVDSSHWEEVVTELNLAFSPDLNIVDGTRTMVSGGPWEGKAVETNLIMAGGDPLACDVIGLSIIKSFGQWEPLNSVSPWQMRQIKRAVELDLGAKDGTQIKLLTEQLGHVPEFEPLMAKVRAQL